VGSCTQRDLIAVEPLAHILLLNETSFDGGGQFLVIGVDHEHWEKPCRLGLACIAADGMAGGSGARRLVETLAGAVDPPRPSFTWDSISPDRT
jgi:hypothetical protein